MGIYSDIQDEVSNAMDTDLSDATVALVLKQLYSDDYDPATGTSRKINIETETRGIAVPVDLSLIDGEVLKIGDVQFIILDSELSELPDLGDFIHYGGEDYEILRSERDPAGSTWQLTGRIT